jgi:hypothetical protein
LIFFFIRNLLEGKTLMTPTDRPPVQAHTTP